MLELAQTIQTITVHGHLTEFEPNTITNQLSCKIYIYYKIVVSSKEMQSNLGLLQIISSHYLSVIRMIEV